MKDLQELLILLGIAPFMLVVTWLMDRHFKIPDDSNAYTLSDDQRHAIKFLVKKQATAAEREKIFNEKFRELIQQQAP
ncbi:hypothetical protein GTP45_21950 [Pseudoduganella sp. FT55W]|uniref:Uncharacterized protein n=1 Tax=Duganella rivi TaxID=2666083 RepID=A0A7X4GTV1_9BURK|nr:hypothetical protein [Duganella rivi]MYM69483.1 hypothetical protein [Duganella rivi]